MSDIENNLIAMDSGDNSVELVDADQSKIEQLELEYEQVKVNLNKIAELNHANIVDLSALAKASQLHLVYVALAQMIKASNETQRELASVLKHKQDLYLQNNKSEQKVGESETNVTNNTLNITPADLLELIKNRSQ